MISLRVTCVMSEFSYFCKFKISMLTEVVLLKT